MDPQMETSDNGMQFIEDHEGVRNDVYLDCAGYPTVGVGHLVQPEDNLDVGDIISDQQVEDFLAGDLDISENAINDDVTVPLTQNQFDALSSFVFNVGTGNFGTSTLLKLLNQGNYGKEISDGVYDGAAGEFPKWCHAGGEVVQGLVNRRADEQALFMTPDAVVEQPAPAPVPAEPVPVQPAPAEPAAATEKPARKIHIPALANRPHPSAFMRAKPDAPTD